MQELATLENSKPSVIINNSKSSDHVWKPKYDSYVNIDKAQIPTMSSLREKWHISNKTCKKFRQVKKIYFKTCRRGPTTTSDQNIILKWNDDYKNYDLSDFKQYKDKIWEKNQISIFNLQKMLDQLSMIKFYNPREIKDWTEGDLKCIFGIQSFNFFGLLVIMTLLLRSVYWWLQWFNFVLLIGAFPYLYYQKRRAWNKLKQRKDAIEKVIVDWNINYYSEKGIELHIGMYGAWQEFTQIENQLINMALPSPDKFYDSQIY